MKCKDFTAIQFSKSRTFSHISSKQKECKAFDTETYNGKPILLADSNGIYSTNQKDIIEQLLDKENKKTVNLFYNLGYDKNAILKFLSNEALSFFATYDYVIEDNIYYGGIASKSLDIAYANKVLNIENLDNGSYKVYLENDIVKEFKKVPRQFISYDNCLYVLEQKVRYFDLWQFFKYEASSSLDNVSKKYLNSQKVDIESLGYDKANLKNADKIIIDYCIQDCVLTKQLGDMVINACNDIGITFNKPYSCATISSDYFFVSKGLRNPFLFLYQYGNFIYNINLEIFMYAYYSYKGGRAEVTKRGYYEDIKEYDVNSMYPYNMTKLYDCFKCIWIKIQGNKMYDYDIDNIAYGFIKCNIRIPNNYVNPLPYNVGFYIYGYGEFKEYYLTIHEIYMMFDLGIITREDIDIIDGWIGLKQGDNELVFKDTIDYIYSERKKYDDSDFHNPLLKIILNSIYGRMIEVNINKSFDDTIDLNDTDSYDILDKEVIKKTFTSGKYFNPIYACYITGLSRIKLFSAIFPERENFIASFTDSIITKEKIKGLSVSKSMGDWGLVEGDLTIIGSGVYRLEGTKAKLRTRGIHIKESLNDNLYGINFDDLIIKPFQQTKVMKLKECIIQDNIEDFNIFKGVEKKVNLNFDKKRNWNYDLRCLQDCYTECDSKPICINEV